jgi:BirA family biotin operon repressor/biotin-[acetyl-CoA-carboxylase] ligase
VALALLISMALEELFSLKTLIKWPNDLVLERKKVGGLLLEARRGAIMAGIGLNLVSPPVWAPKEKGLDQNKLGGQVGGQEGPYLAPLEPGALPISEGPDKLWTKLVDKTRVCYNIIMARPDHPPDGALTPMDLATKRLLGLGQKVAILSPSTEPPFPGRVLTGLLIGLDSSGALLIEKDQGTYAVWSGSLFFEFLS